MRPLRWQPCILWYLYTGFHRRVAGAGTSLQGSMHLCLPVHSLELCSVSCLSPSTYYVCSTRRYIASTLATGFQESLDMIIVLWSRMTARAGFSGAFHQIYRRDIRFCPSLDSSVRQASQLLASNAESACFVQPTAEKRTLRCSSRHLPNLHHETTPSHGEHLKGVARVKCQWARINQMRSGQS